MGYRVDNAVIMAAGLAARFAPISYETPKALLSVRGEILIERQIRQLQEKGIKDVIVVVGYKKEKFMYLQEKYGVSFVENTEYNVRNNHSSIYAARNYLNNTYVCSADNYFPNNVFETEVDNAYYAAVFAEGKTNEWCLQTDEEDWITDIHIGGSCQWYMMGHTFWSEDFSRQYIDILEKIYDRESTKDKLWEGIYMQYIDRLKMKIRRYGRNEIYEFDTPEELKAFDKTFQYGKEMV